MPSVDRPSLAAPILGIGFRLSTMHIIELAPGRRSVPTLIAVRREGLKTVLSLTTEGAPRNTAIVSNFKAWLAEPDAEHPVLVPIDGGKLTLVNITGRQCLAAFLDGIQQILKQGGRATGADTKVLFSAPAYDLVGARKSYLEVVLQTAKESRLGTIRMVREPDAVYEYFRLLRQALDKGPTGKTDVLVIDFGGGTCNVSVVSTTKLGKRIVTAPVAAEAAQAGGLYIDEALLGQAVRRANLQHLFLKGRSTPERQAFESWQTRHVGEVEALKRAVSSTGKAHRLSVALDGELARFAGGERRLEIILTLDQLREFVTAHWEGRGIRRAVEKVMQEFVSRRRQRLEDGRLLISHVVLTGGSSHLPGFVELVQNYFAPHAPQIERIGSDYPFAVGVGMALNELSLTGALGQTVVKAHEQPPSVVSSAPVEVFVPTFEDDINLYWRIDASAPFQSMPIFPSHKSTLELLQDGTQSLTLDLPKATVDSYRRKVEYQVGFPSEIGGDNGDLLEPSGKRFNVLDHRFFDLPAQSKRKVQVDARLDFEPGRYIEIVLAILDSISEMPTTEFRVPILSAKRISASNAPPPPLVSDQPPAEEGHLTQLQGLDALCIDFGTTKTTVVDLRSTGPLPAATTFLKATIPRSIETDLEEVTEPPAGPVSPPVPPRLSPEVLQVTSPPPASTRAAPLAGPSPAGAPAPPPRDRMGVGGAAIGPPSPISDAMMSSQPSALPPASVNKQRLQSPAPQPLPGSPFTGDEGAFVAYLKAYCAEAGFDFPEELLESVYLSLKVRPLVVLAGPSGVGKSGLGRLVAEAFGSSHERRDFIRVAVEAHWTDGRFLFGRRDSHGHFLATDFLRLLRRAIQHPGRLYHVLMDEMNLAHVEYYFAQILSATEGDGWLAIPDRPRMRLPMTAEGMPLLRICGTINVDETTQVLSDKVIDRANIIEVEASTPPADVPVVLPLQRAEQRYHVLPETLLAWNRLDQARAPVPDEIRQIWEIFSAAERSPYWAANVPATALATGVRTLPSHPFGRRISRDIALFVAYAERLGGTVGRHDAIDIQVRQRLLPKIRGDGRIQETLETLARCLEQLKLRRSAERLGRMLAQLHYDHFVTFWS